MALDPNDAKAFNFRGSAYYALKQYLPAIALNPDYYTSAYLSQPEPCLLGFKDHEQTRTS
jgi:hypothetical protein